MRTARAEAGRHLLVSCCCTFVRCCAGSSPYPTISARTTRVMTTKNQLVVLLKHTHQKTCSRVISTLNHPDFFGSGTPCSCTSGTWNQPDTRSARHLGRQQIDYARIVPGPCQLTEEVFCLNTRHSLAGTLRTETRGWKTMNLQAPLALYSSHHVHDPAEPLLKAVQLNGVRHRSREGHCTPTREQRKIRLQPSTVQDAPVRTPLGTSHKMLTPKVPTLLA